MKKLTMVLTVLAVLLSFSSMANAQADHSVWKANIPFSFHVENQSMPAGEYRVEFVGWHVCLTAEAGKHAACVLSFPKEGRTTQTSSRLEFNNYGGERFLNQIYFAGQEQTRELLKSKLETELAKKSRPATVAVVAGQ